MYNPFKKTKKCEVCQQKKQKKQVTSVGLGKYVCIECNTPEKKEDIQQQAIELGERMGLPKDLMEKLVKKK